MTFSPTALGVGPQPAIRSVSFGIGYGVSTTMYTGAILTGAYIATSVGVPLKDVVVITSIALGLGILSTSGVLLHQAVLGATKTQLAARAAGLLAVPALGVVAGAGVAHLIGGEAGLIAALIPGALAGAAAFVYNPLLEIRL